LCLWINFGSGPLESVDCVVIGGGVVGLATARRLAQAGLEVIVVEAEKAVGTGISARNSEVIHAGIYYPKDSLKAVLCVEGRELLYNYCKDRNIAAKAVGKFIVAANAAQDGELAAIRQRAVDNHVTRLEFWSAAQVAEVEPDIRCHSALFSPDTGIIDIHAFMLSLVGDLESMGGWIALASPVEAIAVRESGFEVSVGGQEPMTIGARIVVNAAGLKALGVEPLARIHHMTVIGGDPVIMLEAPIPATERALKKAGMSIGDIDLFEVNEAFASVPVAWLQHLGADPDKLNINGGAIALGHPLGGSGAKLMTTLIHALKERGKRYGLQTMCEGGGLANVTIVERL